MQPMQTWPAAIGIALTLSTPLGQTECHYWYLPPAGGQPRGTGVGIVGGLLGGERVGIWFGDAWRYQIPRSTSPFEDYLQSSLLSVSPFLPLGDSGSVLKEAGGGGES